MVPIVKLVYDPDGEWMVIYFHSNISDRKVWEGHPVDTGAICALSETFGYPVHTYEFTDPNEIDGSTPDTFAEIKGIKSI